MKDYNIQIMSHGSCIDRDSSLDKVFQIDTFTLRLDSKALSDYVASQPIHADHWEEDYETWDAFEIDRKRRNDLRKAWNDCMLNAIGVSWRDGYRFTQITAEFFAVAHISKV